MGLVESGSSEPPGHRSSPGGDYGGVSATARITRRRVPHREQGSSGSMTNPPRLSRPSVVMATCRGGNARAAAMHSEQTAPRCSLRNSAISLRNVAGTAQIPGPKIRPRSQDRQGPTARPPSAADLSLRVRRWSCSVPEARDEHSDGNPRLHEVESSFWASHLSQRSRLCVLGRSGDVGGDRQAHPPTRGFAIRPCELLARSRVS
jgi:hypothetical protein